MKVLILGAGVVGVTSAWYLAKAGHEVTVIERQPAPGMETSFANGGQISVSHAEPWANPGAPAKILKWLGREDAPLLFRLRADWRQWSWGLRFLFECLPSRTRRNTLTILRLALYSRMQLQALRRETGIVYDQLQKGILHLHTDEAEFAAARSRVALMQSHGVALSVKTAGEVLALEPALRESTVKVVGGTYAPEDESGDAHLFAQRLAVLAQGKGATLRHNAQILGLHVEGDRIGAVEVREGGRSERLRADAYLVALGSYSPLLTARIGVHLPVYPVKGYSVTVPIGPNDAAPSLCLTDENAKIAISRLGHRLRAAGTAELTGYDTSITAARCEAIVERLRLLFPRGGDYACAARWAGLRPATPGNVPLIGRTRFANLYLNTGHGTLGWTLACGSGAAIADLISGRRPEVDFPFCRTARNPVA
ncbi:MAG TPA: D-amino acid dehydrogenase [Burkholderiales bacterium]|jgi:D-amino-acid dehydrogenase|nr:D-amino acid dehydrogenase [Burkholderiales bacterium]